MLGLVLLGSNEAVQRRPPHDKSHTHTYACTHSLTHTHAHTCMHVHTHAHTCTHMTRIVVQHQMSIFAGMKCRPTSRRCGLCENCLQADCGQCKYCKDKPRFGGPGKLKQACSKKKCLKLAKPKLGRKFIQ